MRRLFWIFWSAGEKFIADDGWAIASYIGLTLLTSLFPFLIFVAALAGFFGSAELAKEAARLVFAEWPDVVARPIAEEVSNVLTAPRSGLLTLGVVLSSWFASSAIEALRVGLNRAYGLVESRPWWLLRLQSLGLVLVGSLALLALAFLVVLGPLILDALGAYLPWVAAARELLTFARLAVAAFMLATTLLLAHLILPAHRPRLVDLLPGVALTFAGSIIFSEAFGVVSQPVRAELHFDVRGPRLGDDRARLSLLGGAAVRFRRRAQRGDHARGRAEPGLMLRSIKRAASAPC